MLSECVRGRVDEILQSIRKLADTAVSKEMTFYDNYFFSSMALLVIAMKMLLMIFPALFLTKKYVSLILRRMVMDASVMNYLS